MGDEKRGRPRSSSLADPGPSWSMCTEAVPLEDGIAGTQERRQVGIWSDVFLCAGS